MAFLDSLNPQQKKIVEKGDGMVIIKAGPGTGKTKVLTSRIAFLLLEKAISPENILALTFTQKAAAEMQDRLKLLWQGHLPKVTTFHGFAFEFLQNLGQHIKIIEKKEQNELISEIIKTNKAQISPRQFSLLLSIKKSRPASRQSPTNERLFDLYQKNLQEKKLLDYDDLLITIFTCLNSAEKQRKLLQDIYYYFLVDEFQDTNNLQYEIIKLLLNEKKNLFVIGDPRQAIYSFRGASNEVFAQLKSDFPEAKEETLTINYRSFVSIVKTGNNLFPESPLQARHLSQGKVVLLTTLDEYTEADLVVRIIEEKIGGSDLSTARNTDEVNSRFSDFAVIYRTHHLSKIVQNRLTDSGLPFQVAGEGSLYEEKNVALIIETLQTQKDDLGKIPLSQAVEKIIKEKAIPRYTAILQLLGNLVRFNALPDGVDRFLDYIEKIKAYDFYDQKCDKIALLTMHAAKGLEFKFVFLLGFEQGIIPLVQKNMEADEEKRLFYVAITRPKEELFLIQTKTRHQKTTKPSLFLESIRSPFLTEKSDETIAKILKKREARRIKKSQMTFF